MLLLLRNRQNKTVDRLGSRPPSGRAATPLYTLMSLRSRDNVQANSLALVVICCACRLVVAHNYIRVPL